MADAVTPSEGEPAVLAYGPHPAQFLEVHRPETGAGPRKTVVLIHGGFWRLPWGLELMRPLARDLVGRGYAAVNVEYRRLGEAGGGWPGTCLDIAAALDLLATSGASLGLDTDGIGLVGHSAGGHLALWAAARPGARADARAGGRTGPRARIVVSQAGVADLRAAVRDRLDEEGGKPPAALEFLGDAGSVDGGGDAGSADSVGDAGGRPGEPGAYPLASPIEMPPLGPGVRLLVLHGDADDRVPPRQSLDYVRAAESAGGDVRLVTFTGMGHFELIDPAHESWRVTVRELDRCLCPGG